MLFRERGVLSSSCVHFCAPSATARSLFLTLECAGLYDCDENYRVERSCYDSGLLLLVLEGEGYAYVRGKRQRLRTGDLLLLDCYQKHCYGTDVGFRILWAHFAGCNAQRFLHAAEAYPSILHADIDRHSLKQALESLYRALDQGRCMPDAQAHSLLTKLVTAFLAPTSTDMESAAQRMEQVAAYISSHLSERITLEDLAGLVHLSPSQLIRVFKHETGFSPHQYILEARLNAARFSLASTQLSLSQIADQCGFADASALVNAFRKRTGMSPRAYALRQLGPSEKSWLDL